jgi:hypothetical protein
MKRSTLKRVVPVAGVCALAGAGAGIAGSAAAPSSGRNAPQGAGVWSAHSGPDHRFLLGGPPVHDQAVVLNKAGNGFITVTRDHGKVKSISGSDITITEGVGSVKYKDVTITIPSGATIYRNGAKATVADIKAGDHVVVSQSAEGTMVLAGDRAPDKFGPGRRGFRMFREHRGYGPPPPGGPDVPPGAPG